VRRAAHAARLNKVSEAVLHHEAADCKCDPVEINETCDRMGDTLDVDLNLRPNC